ASSIGTSAGSAARASAVGTGSGGSAITPSSPGAGSKRCTSSPAQTTNPPKIAAATLSGWPSTFAAMRWTSASSSYMWSAATRPAPGPGGGGSRSQHRRLDGLDVGLAGNDRGRAVDRRRRVLQAVTGEHADDASLGAVAQQARHRRGRGRLAEDSFAAGQQPVRLEDLVIRDGADLAPRRRD